MSKKLKAKRYKNASDRATYEIFHADPAFLKPFARILQTKFGFWKRRDTIIDIDVISLEFTNGKVRLDLEWDIWSGCMLSAKQPAGDEHVEAIGDYMDVYLMTL